MKKSSKRWSAAVLLSAIFLFVMGLDIQGAFCADVKKVALFTTREKDDIF